MRRLATTERELPSEVLQGPVTVEQRRLSSQHALARVWQVGPAHEQVLNFQREIRGTDTPTFSLLGPILTLPAWREQQTVNRLISRPDLAVREGSDRRRYVLLRGLRIMGQKTEWDKEKMVEWLANLLYNNGELAYLLRFLVEAYATEAVVTEDFTQDEWTAFHQVTREVFARYAWPEEGLLNVAFLPKEAREDLFIGAIAAEEPFVITRAFRVGFEDSLSLWNTLEDNLFKAPDYGLLAYLIRMGYINPLLAEEIATQAGNKIAADLVKNGCFEKKHDQRLFDDNDEEV